MITSTLSQIGHMNGDKFSESIYVTTGNGRGSVNTMIRRFTTVTRSTGTAITYADSATLGATFTINANGLYFIIYNDNHFGGLNTFGISLNSNQLTTSINTITASNRLSMVTAGSSNNSRAAFCIRQLSAGDILRAHTDGVTTSTQPRTAFQVNKLKT